MTTPTQHLEIKMICGITMKEYQHIHHWMKKNYGPANMCENINCIGKSKKYSWAKKPGKEYKKDRDCFEMLCVTCHNIQDTTDYKRRVTRERMTGVPLSEEHKNNIRESQKGRVFSKESRLKMSISATGCKNNGAKLREEDVLKIRALKESKTRISDIRKMFGISAEAIRNIVNRTTWKHI